jgi:predicted PurR-regulated permease PerM
MTLQNQLKVWATLFVVFVLVLWVFRGILLPFIAGIALAYLLNPVVGLLERARISRGWAAAAVLGVVIMFVVWALLLVVPLITDQAVGLATRLPGYFTELQALLNRWAPEIYQWLGVGESQQAESGVTDIFTRGLGIVGNLAAQLAQSGLTLLNAFGLVIITPVVAFYILLDWDAMMRYVDNLLPREHRIEIQGVLAEIDRAMAGVLRGQGSVVVVLSFYYSAALTMTGLSFGLAVGLLAGVLSFVPYVGFLTGFVLSMAIALVQFWPDWVMVLIVFLVFAVGQFLESNILYPKLVGSSIGVNPVWLMFALFAFALLFGFVGLLLAVPLSALAGVLTRFAVRKYKQSSLYLGRPGSGGDSSAAG